MSRTGLALAVCLLGARVAAAGRGALLVNYLADDASFVVVADVAHARGTAMFASSIELARGKLAWWGALATAGIAVDRLVDTIVIGGDFDQHVVIVVEGRLDKLVVELERAKWKLGGLDAALVDKRLVFARTADLAAVIARVHTRRAKGSPRVRALLAAATSGSDVFGGISLPPGMRAGLGTALGGEPEAVAFSVAAATQLTVELKLRLPDEATAQSVAQRVSGGLPLVQPQLEAFGGKAFFDSIIVDWDRAVVRIAATLTAEEADRVVPLAIDAM